MYLSRKSVEVVDLCLLLAIHNRFHWSPLVKWLSTMSTHKTPQNQLRFPRWPHVDYSFCSYHDEISQYPINFRFAKDFVSNPRNSAHNGTARVWFVRIGRYRVCHPAPDQMPFESFWNTKKMTLIIEILEIFQKNNSLTLISMQHFVVLKSMSHSRWPSFAVIQMGHRPILANPFVKPAHAVTVDFFSDLYTLCNETIKTFKTWTFDWKSEYAWLTVAKWVHLKCIDRVYMDAVPILNAAHFGQQYMLLQ